jgi:hypothetical protein
LLVGGREAGGKSIPAERRSARIQKHDIVRHQTEQAVKIAGVDGINPNDVHLTDGSLIRSHLQPPLPSSLITRQSASTPPSRGPLPSELKPPTASASIGTASAAFSKNPKIPYFFRLRPRAAVVAQFASQEHTVALRRGPRSHIALCAMFIRTKEYGTPKRAVLVTTKMVSYIR